MITRNIGAPHLLALSNIDTWPVHIERENATSKIDSARRCSTDLFQIRLRTARLGSHAQQTCFESVWGSHPHPLAPAALASASWTQQALALPGAGPPQHELVFRSVPVRLSFVAVFDIVVLLIEVSTRCSPANDEDGRHPKKTQRLFVLI
jgi:hypothetical protein